MSSGRRERAALYTAAGLAALVAGSLWLLWPSFRILRTSEPSPAQPQPLTAEQMAAVGAPPVRAGATGPSPTGATQVTATPTETAAEPTPSANVPVVGSLAKVTADDYRRRARYPRYSQPLADGEDPILRDREVSPVTAPGQDGEEPLLTVFPEHVSFESPDVVRLYAYLSMRGERVPARQIAGDVQTERLQTVGRIEFRDDGEPPDGAAGDALYSAAFDPGPDAAKQLSASYLVRVRAVTQDGDPRVAATGFLYSTPHAHLTGRYQDALVEGDLAVDAEVEVSTQGRFHLEASLYAADGRPLAWAQAAQELGPGLHWMRLPFFGLILRERQVDGPYSVRYVALSTTTQMPNAKNDIVENAHMTAAYAATDFREQPFNDPDLLDAAERLERDTRGARPLDARP